MNVILFPGDEAQNPYIMNRNMYGNDVIPRSAYLPSGAQKGWLNREAPLVEGRLTAFYYYIHSNQTRKTMEIYIQIWRRTSQRYKYQLVWQRKITFTTSDREGLVKVRIILLR